MESEIGEGGKVQKKPEMEAGSWKQYIYMEANENRKRRCQEGEGRI